MTELRHMIVCVGAPLPQLADVTAPIATDNNLLGTRQWISVVSERHSWPNRWLRQTSVYLWRMTSSEQNVCSTLLGRRGLIHSD